MERATIYRAISAPTALVGSCCALAVSAWLFWRLSHAPADRAQAGPAFTTHEFAMAWLVALFVTLAANTLFIWKEAQRDRRPLFSPGLRLALRSVSPPLFVAALMTALTWQSPDEGVALALIWIGFYGLALLATMNFAPRSLSVLGWAFMLTAAIWITLLATGASQRVAVRGQPAIVMVMGLTFGIYHLVYAACTWRRRRPDRDELGSE